MWCVHPLSITKAICFERGGRLREWCPAVRALRVVIRALAEEATRRSTGEASGHSDGWVEWTVAPTGGVADGVTVVEATAFERRGPVRLKRGA
eukprot:2037842-Pleurochrysis_carterae.AAC.1